MTAKSMLTSLLVCLTTTLAMAADPPPPAVVQYAQPVYVQPVCYSPCQAVGQVGYGGHIATVAYVQPVVAPAPASVPAPVAYVATRASGPCFWTNEQIVTGSGVDCTAAFLDAYEKVGGLPALLPPGCLAVELVITDEQIVSSGSPCVVEVTVKVFICCLDQIPF